MKPDISCRSDPGWPNTAPYREGPAFDRVARRERRCRYGAASDASARHPSRRPPYTRCTRDRHARRRNVTTTTPTCTASGRLLRWIRPMPMASSHLHRCPRWAEKAGGRRTSKGRGDLIVSYPASGQSNGDPADAVVNGKRSRSRGLEKSGRPRRRAGARRRGVVREPPRRRYRANPARAGGIHGSRRSRTAAGRGRPHLWELRDAGQDGRNGRPARCTSPAARSNVHDPCRIGPVPTPGQHPTRFSAVSSATTRNPGELRADRVFLTNTAPGSTHIASVPRVFVLIVCSPFLIYLYSSNLFFLIPSKTLFFYTRSRGILQPALSLFINSCLVFPRSCSSLVRLFFHRPVDQFLPLFFSH